MRLLSAPILSATDTSSLVLARKLGLPNMRRQLVLAAGTPEQPVSFYLGSGAVDDVTGAAGEALLVGNVRLGNGELRAV
jgi:hypothetical protein